MTPQAAVAAVATLCSLLPQYWPDAPLAAALPAQIEKETCVTLTNVRCFSPEAELKTSREFGFGLGHITITAAFNNFAVVKREEPALKDWALEKRSATPREQLIALLHMDWAHRRRCGSQTANNPDAIACTLASYNGGWGGFLSDRRVCSNTQGCDPTHWSYNVENTSLKANVPAKGYGKSFFQLNPEYVSSILVNRTSEYSAMVASAACPPRRTVITSPAISHEAARRG